MAKIERADITDDAKRYTHQLIHDVLREWIQSQPQEVVNYLLLNQKLKSQEAYIPVVENSLNFASAQFQEVSPPVLDLSQFEQVIDHFIQLDLKLIETLSEYYLPEGQYHAVVAKNGAPML